MGLVPEKDRDRLGSNALLRAVKLAEASKQSLEKTPEHTYTQNMNIAMTSPPLSPIFILPPQRSLAVTIKSPGQADLQQALPSLNSSNTPPIVNTLQNASPTLIASCSFPDSTTATYSMAPLETEDAATATRRKFMESVWALSKADNAGTESGQQAPMRSTKSIANPRPSDAPPKELKAKAQKTQQADLEEMEYLAKIRALPHDSEERKLIIKERRMEGRRREKEAKPARRDQIPSIKKHTQSAHKPYTNSKTTTTQNTNKHVGLPNSNARTVNSSIMYPRKPEENPQYEAHKAKSGSSELQKTLSAMHEMNANPKTNRAVKDNSFITRKQTVNVDSIYYDIETLKAHDRLSMQGYDNVDARDDFSFRNVETTPEKKSTSTRTLYQATPYHKSAPSKVASQPSQHSLGYGLTSNALNHQSSMDIGTSKAARLAKSEGKENFGEKHAEVAKPVIEDSSSEDEEEGGAPLWD